MLDLRPVGYVIGLLVAALGVTMLAPLAVDLADGNGRWPVFLESALIAILGGGLSALACSNGVGKGLSLRQTFLVTVVVWVVLPVFGALPFVLGDTALTFTDAMFEATSGLTTTGSTVISGLDDLPRGILLWRGMLQWLGGVGIIVVAMVFLPELKVGGMQIFRSEGFDTMGKILPRAAEIASRISVIYVALTLACVLAYAAAGMKGFDAVVHAMTTLSTGGMANTDASFGAYGAAIHYIAVVFMILAALPFVRYVQLVAGTARPLAHDPQVRGFLLTLLVVAGILALWIDIHLHDSSELAFREALFNATSILTGTGYASANYMTWGSFAISVIFFAGLIGGCAGSTACSVKVFRYQLLIAAIRAQVRQIHSPSGVFTPRYAGRPVGEDVINSVMSFFVAFVVTLGVLAVALTLTGLDFVTSISGAATAVGNIGPGLGEIIGPAGNFQTLNAPAKWLLVLGMLIGRLELMAVFVLFTRYFWRQ